jgi:hypothetical protein
MIVELQCARLKCLLLSFVLSRVDLQSPAAEVGTGQRYTRLVGFCRIRHFNEGEAPWPSGLLIGHNADALHRSVSREQSPQFMFSGGKREIANVKVLHNISSLDRASRLVGFIQS